MQATPFLLFSAAFGLWLTLQSPPAPLERPADGLPAQLARDLAIAHQDAVAYVQGTGAAGSPLTVTPVHPGQTIWWPQSCSDGVWIATYARPSRDVDESSLFRAVDALLDGPLTAGVARSGSLVRYGTTIAALPCAIADGKAVLLTHG